MIRVRIKSDAIRFQAVIELIEKGYKINVTNKDGNCLYVWDDGQKRCDISHWTNDKQIMEVKNLRQFTALI